MINLILNSAGADPDRRQRGVYATHSGLRRYGAGTQGSHSAARLREASTRQVVATLGWIMKPRWGFGGEFVNAKGRMKNEKLKRGDAVQLGGD